MYLRINTHKGDGYMSQCERCRRLENEVILVNMLFGAIHNLIIGEEVSDFELSFPIVREVSDLINSQSKLKTDPSITKDMPFTINIGRERTTILNKSLAP